MTDTDLAKGRLEQRQQQASAPMPAASRRRIARPSFTYMAKLLFLLAAAATLCLVIIHYWIPDRHRANLRFPRLWRPAVSGIIYTAENPSAVVYGKLVREGDTIRGYKVLKIHKDKVELQKNGEVTVRRAF